MVIVTLEHNYNEFVNKKIDFEHRAFLTMQEAKKWLEDNNFYYGQRPFFQYTPADAREWCHKKDASWEFIDVSFETIDDPDKPSRYKDFDPGIAPWHEAAFEEGRREGYAKMLIEAGLSREVMIKEFMKHFDDSEADAAYWISVCEAGD